MSINIFGSRRKYHRAITGNSFDETSELLILGQEWNTNGDMNSLLMNIDDVILPLITEKIIIYHCWREPSFGDDSNEINTDMLPQFEKFMQRYSRMIDSEGVEAIIKKLFR
jgi:hypothetical protein